MRRISARRDSCVNMPPRVLLDPNILTKLPFFGLGIYQWMDAKILNSLIGVVGGRRGVHMIHPSYFVCSIILALPRHPRIK